jgi:predicted RNase H-like HicB family nuclease
MSAPKLPEYSMRVTWSAEDDAFIAVCPELHGISAFGSSPEDAAKELSVAIALAIEVMVEDGDRLPEAATVHTFSGQLRVRMPRSLHARLSDQAEREGVSLNTLIVSHLERSTGVDLALSRVAAVQQKLVQAVLVSSRAAWGVHSSGTSRAIFEPRLLPKGTQQNASALLRTSATAVSN